MRLSHFLSLLVLVAVPTPTMPAQTAPAAIDPLVRSVDLTVGEQAEVALSDGVVASVKLVALREQRDEVCQAVRVAMVTVEVNGQRAELVSATYHLPQVVGGVQIDCPVTKGYNEKGTPAFWGLAKDARLRLWPAKSPWIRPDTFVYPVKQRWFASETQMANAPVFVDGGEGAGKKSIYYHSGLDIGGCEGLVEVVAAADSLIVSVGDAVHPDHQRDTPVSPRYDVVYLLDGRGWYYRYSHLKEIDKRLVPGRTLAKGQRVGLLGKEGGSGGWSHLHFEIKSRQPSGRWGTQEGYAFLWQAMMRQQQPDVVAVARPHHLVWSGSEVTLDGAKSWAAGEIASYQWQLGGGETADGARVARTYAKPGRYQEVLRVADRRGRVSYDFATVIVIDRDHPERRVPSIHPAYFPTSGIRPGDPVTFKVRTFNTTHGKETWDFGDGVSGSTQSDGNAVKLAPDGYAVTTHRFQKPGDYVVRVERTDQHGVTAVGHLHVRVDSPPAPSGESRAEPGAAWPMIAPYFSVPPEFAGDLGGYRSPLIFNDGSRVQTAQDWPRRRAELRKQWTDLLGSWPPLITQPQVEVLESRQRGELTQHKVRFLWTPAEQTTGYLLIPPGSGRRPAVITVYYEPETAIGEKGELRDFAIQLARRGFVTLSIGTTEATAAKTYSLYYPDIDKATVQPLSMLGCAAANAWHVLASRSEVDSERIGIVGHSFGGKWALFAGCLFDRFAAVAVSDPGIMFDTKSNVNYWEPWYLGWHPRPWRPRGVISAENPGRGLYPQLLEQGRDLHELHALLAPRPLLVSGGAVDPPPRWRALNHRVQIDELLGKSARVGMTNRPDHSPNEQSNEIIYRFFEHFLGPAGQR